jgi:hypothetical protein
VRLLAPLFLLGLAGVLVPLWLHRRERDDPRRLPVSSLMHFEPGRASFSARRRLRDPTRGGSRSPR